MPTNPETRRCGSRSGPRAPTRYLASGDFAECDRLLDEALEWSGDDQSAGAGIIIGCPVAFAVHCKGALCRERGQFAEAEELLEQALRIATEQGDPETESWTRGQIAILASVRGDTKAAMALAERNYELTERLGDVFSRTWALTYLCFVRLGAGDGEGALDAIERAERLYREAMNGGGEAEAWRRALHAEALVAVGRTPEGLEEAERAVQVAREREMRWSQPRTLRALAAARAASGEADGAREALDQASAVAQEIGFRTELDAIEVDRERIQVKAT